MSEVVVINKYRSQCARVGAHHAKLPLATSASGSEVPMRVPAAALPIQLPAVAPGKAVQESPRT